MDIVGSREIAKRFQISQEQARLLLRNNFFESQIQMPCHGKRKVFRTTKRALLLKALTQGYPLTPDEEAYLKKLSKLSSTPNGSETGSPEFTAESGTLVI